MAECKDGQMNTKKIRQVSGTRFSSTRINRLNITTSGSLSDDKTSRRMLTLWTNFAKYRDPTPFHDNDFPFWSQFNDKEKFMDINKNGLKMNSKIYPVRMTFLNKVLLNEHLRNLDEICALPTPISVGNSLNINNNNTLL